MTINSELLSRLHRDRKISIKAHETYHDYVRNISFLEYHKQLIQEEYKKHFNGKE